MNWCALDFRSLTMVLTILVGVFSAFPALAQRGITNSASGNDDPPLVRHYDSLLDCNIRNTGKLGVGNADACAGAQPNGETLDAVRALAASYSSTHGYQLTLTNETADRMVVGDTVSSGGLFGLLHGVALSGSSASEYLKFRHDQIGNFVLAVSGHYDNNGTQGDPLAFSSYFLFDFVEVKAGDPDDFEGLLVRNFHVGAALVILPAGGFDQRETYDFTNGMHIEQLSMFELERVPEAGSAWLVGLALMALVAGRRKKQRVLAV